jgi:hypothetical protein
MAAIKIDKFLGAAPKIASEHLPNGAAQIAYNLQLYSGDLIPYSEPLESTTIPRLGELKTIFGMRSVAGAALDWLSWTTDVDITTISPTTDDEQRFYYTGDGVPKVTTYALATTGVAPYPIAFYNLGLPLPTVVATAAVVAFVPSTSASYERDTGNTATITTGAVHGLRTGNIVTVRDFTGTIPLTFNVVNARVTVTGTTTFEYYSAGDVVASVADTTATIDLAGATATRDYTYTWLTPWEEESIAADPSEKIFLKEGGTSVVTGLPTAAPSGDNLIQGMKLYRTLSTASGTEFYRLSDLWFPIAGSTVLRATNVVTLTLAVHHNLIVDDKFKLANCADATFDIVDGVVLSVPDDHTITYAQTAGDVGVKAQGTAILYHNVAELPANETRYWGDANIASVSYSRDTKVVTFVTSTAHHFVTGQSLAISGCTDVSFNAAAGVITVVDATSFTYEPDGIATASWSRDGANVVTLVTSAVHGLTTGDVTTISGLTVGATDPNGTDVTITVTNTTTFTYANTAATVVSTADTGGKVLSDEASAADTGAVLVNFSYADDFDFLNLVDILLTDEYDEPNAAMQGLIVGQNNLVAGFFDNQLCFAEPGKPHAWPIKYRRTFEYDIVALADVSGSLIVLTGTHCFRVNGSDPSTLAIAKIDTLYPCLSKRSVVNMGYGLLYATYGGLAMWRPDTGLTLATKLLHNWDTWDETNNIDPATIVGTYFDDQYFGAHDSGSFIFERDEKVGGYYVTAGHKFNSAWLDVSDSSLYTSSDLTGTVDVWNSSDAIKRPMEWKSKTLVIKDYINIGAARVVADYAVTAEDIAAYATWNDAVVAYNAAIWVDSEQLGTVNGPTDYLDAAGVAINNFGELNSTVVHGAWGELVRSRRTAPSTYSITFQLWQNKELVFTQILTNSKIFRCPAGYKSDTFEVSVAGVARIRAIHLSETPDGLRKA